MRESAGAGMRWRKAFSQLRLILPWWSYYDGWVSHELELLNFIINIKSVCPGLVEQELSTSCPLELVSILKPWKRFYLTFFH